MAKLKIHTEGAAAPGQEEARRQHAKAERKAGHQQGALFKTEKAQLIDEGPDYTRQRIRVHKKDEVNPYADAQDERYSMDARLRPLIITAVVLVVVFVLVCILPTNVFNPTVRADRSLGTLAGEMAGSFAALVSFFANPDSMYATRVLTVVVTLLAGAAIGLSGGVFQGALKNALASPSTLGVTNGGTIGIIIYCVFVAPSAVSVNYRGSIETYQELVDNMSPFQYFCEVYGAFLSSFLGCVVIVVLVMAIALLAGRGRVSNASLVIAGQVFASAINVIVAWVRQWLTQFGDANLVVYLDMATQTFTGAYLPITVLSFAVPLLACMAVIFLMSNRLSLLAFNDEEARSMGISTVATRNVMVGVCTVMTALVVAFAGPVGFVGFMVPHLARKVVGPDFHYLLPMSALLGAVLVCAVYYLTELGIPWLPSGSTGVFTSVIGCVLFLVMALRRRGASGGEWL